MYSSSLGAQRGRRCSWAKRVDWQECLVNRKGKEVLERAELSLKLVESQR